jgi:dolichol-phosphate mannosyltransferase
MTKLPKLPPRFLTALPVYNEVATVGEVLDAVVGHSPHVLVVDDGSDDGTADVLRARSDIVVVTHPENRGYGAALMTAFDYAQRHEYEVLVTIDCDGQHEPQRIGQFVDTCRRTGADIVSGSRYLTPFDSNTEVPAQRRWINEQITRELNDALGLDLTDAFCGFKAYRVAALRKLQLVETGYAMPLEVWVQAACHDLKIVEVAVPRIYLSEKRSFGGQLDDPAVRLNYYHRVLDRSLSALPLDCSARHGLPSAWPSK